MSSSNEYLRHSSSVAAAVAAAMFAVAPAIHADVTLAPEEGTTTNVLALYTGDTAVEIAGPGTVKLNNSNSHTGGTTLTGGTLEISGDVTASGRSPVGTGTFTVSGGTLRGSGTFGGNITGEGEFNIKAPDGWTWTGNHSFGAAVTLADGSLTVADGSMAFSDNLWLGVGGSDVSFTMTGGSITMGTTNPQFSPKKYAKSRFTMTGGTFNANGRNVLTGYKTTYATNAFDVSGSAVFYNVGNVYTYSGSGNVMDINVHDGGTLDCSAIYNGNDTAGTAKTNLRVDGGILRCNKKGSTATSYALWIGQTSANVKRQLTSFTIGPKGATFTTDNGDASGVMQIYSPITAEAAVAGETAAGVTLSGGRFAYYVPTAYEGPTIIKDGATLYLSADGTIPSGSAVTVESGSMLRLQGADKTISSLTLEEGAGLGFGTPSSGANSALLTVSGSVTLPNQAQIALYTLATPAGVAKDANGTYAVLEVPAASAAALRAVHWSCATAVSGKAYTFSVATSGDWTTLSMTIADDPNAGAGSITGSSTLNVDDYAVASDIVVNNSGTLVAKKNIYGSATGGSITINDGGTLDASAGTISPVNASGNSFQLHLNDGGNLVVNSIEGAQSLADESTSTPMFHFNGGTIYPSFAKKPNDGNRFLLNYQAALIGEHGVVIDMTRLQRPDDYTRWVRSSIQGNVNHDPDCSGDDGGITIRGVKGDRSVVYFGNRFNGSTLTGGISVEDGATVAIGGSALIGQTISLDPGARLRPYNTTSTIQIGSLTLGKTEATEPVFFDGSDSMANYNIVVSNELSVLSPVVFSVCGGWDKDSSPASGVYTALVCQASCSVDPSLFQLPAGCAGTLSASEVILSGGDYDGWTALVVTIDNDIVVTGATEYPSPKTVSADVSCGSIVVGGSWNGEAAPAINTSLTISGNVKASTALYMGYNPAEGASASDQHQGTLTIENGASLSVPVVYSAFRSANNSQNVPRYGSEIYVNGGLLDVSGNVRFGNHWSKYGEKLYSRLTVNGGRVTVGGTFYLSYWNNNGGNRTMPGCIVLNDGEVDVKGKIDLSRNNVAANDTSYENCFGVFLNGGVLKAENIMMTTNATKPKVVFNGGTYMPYGVAEANRTMQDLSKAYVSTNGAVISTANIPAGETYTIAQNLLTDPALSGTADGGLTKQGAGTLALTGANTFTGQTKVEAGTLVAGSASALSDSVAVADGAVLDANGKDLELTDVAASGIIVADSVTVSGDLKLAGEGSILSVDGALTLANGAAIDFAALGEDVSSGWTPVAAASGSITLPTTLRASNAGDSARTRCMTMLVDNVLYVSPTSPGFSIIVR